MNSGTPVLAGRREGLAFLPMATIATIDLEGPWQQAGLWSRVAAEVPRWLAQQGLSPRDAVLLLPFAALLAPARAALAQAGGWQPRVETPLTLAATLGPPAPVPAGTCCGDAVGDRLAAAALLARQPWGAAWERRDPAGHAALVALLVDAAQTLREAALARAPEDRGSFWQAAREALGASAGPAEIEGLLLRLALDWAVESATAPTDRLFELRPAAWMALQIGGPDALAEGLLGHAGTPSLRLLADPHPDQPFARPAGGGGGLERIVCDDFESEAHAAASAVISAIDAGRTPVGLVALDRGLLRRVRALLERQGLPLHDETGWLLATTSAATRVVALLRAALPEAGPDARLDWLKTWPLAPAAARDALEALWRRRRHVPQAEAAEHLWAEAQGHLAPLRATGPLPLAGWLETLQGVLARDGSFDALAADPAGQQVITALGLDGRAVWRAAAAGWRLDLPGFIAWVEATLEAAPYLPPAEPGAPVVLTPLARAFGRGFAQVVLPAADARHLGGAEAGPSLIGPALALQLGLAHAAARRLRQRLALAQVLRCERVTLLRRRQDADEPVAESPDVEWLLIERARLGLPGLPARPAAPAMAVRPVASPRLPSPAAAQALPSTLSATQLQALRDCPYRFFVRAVLRLAEDDELDVALAKRDYGEWLHEVLHRFHRDRNPAVPLLAQLQAAADAVTQARGIEPAELLPFRASFERFAPAYAAWLAARDAEGWRWHSGETDHRIAPDNLGGLALRGRLDRLDEADGGRRQLIDYKTSAAQALKSKVKTPLDDVQLAFYAALLGADEKLEAAYLAIDGADAPEVIAQPGVAADAQALLEGLAGEWQRLKAGAGLPALGEGTVCDTCEARGLCRRDHWA